MEAAGLHSIILGYDGSEGATEAAKLAADIARANSARVVVVTCFSPLPRIAAPGDDVVREIHESRALADEMVERLGSWGVESEPDVLEGPAAEAILNAANAHEADLIVVGSRGLGQFRGLLLGSVSDRVVRYASVPVLVAR